MTARKQVPQRPALAPKCRMVHDETRDRDVLLYPEGALLLNPTGRRILELVDGERTVGEIVERLQEEYEVDGIEDDVRGFLEGVAAKGLLKDG